MRIRDCFNSGRPVVSFEFFPPKTEEAMHQLYDTVGELSALDPSFVSVTYGAGGSTRQLTVELVERIKSGLGLEAVAHLTCVGHSAQELSQVLDRLEAAGIENILALRGDPPKGQEQFVRHESGFGYASELITFVREKYPFCVAAACYPEKHVEASDLESDLRHLKEKEDAGAEVLISQLFFDVASYFRFLDAARQIGIRSPILPGILPLTNRNQFERIIPRCGAAIPDDLKIRVDRVGTDDAAVAEVGVEWATEQCSQLLESGAPGIHFYTLNRSRATTLVFENLKNQLRKASNSAVT